MTDNDSGGTSNRNPNQTRELTVSQAIEATPTRVYEAFLDPDELVAWMHPPGFEAQVHEFQAEEGGTYHISMSGATEETAKHGHSYTGTFEELVPGERIVQTEVPDADTGMDGEMTVTGFFEEAPDGTEVTVRIEIPAAWPDEAIGGWEAALANLSRHFEG